MIPAAVALALAHFGAPLAYRLAAGRWLARPWGLERGPRRPTVTVIVPTYNEAKFVEAKLDDIAKQSYPKELMEVIVVDSASSDGTAQIARRWAAEHPQVKLLVVEEPERRGKAHALNAALKAARGEVVVITDADSTWAAEDTLERALSWFADPRVGAVTCLKKPAGKGAAGVEEGYRRFYNAIRVAESKVWATPIFHGELAAFRRDLLEANGGFPTDLGADDSHTATLIALKGYRAIAPDDVWCIEAVPRKGYHKWRVRRAQHLIQHFARAIKRVREAPGPFRKVLLAEAWLHLANPWLLAAAALLLALEAARGSPLAAALLALGFLPLACKPYRTWVAMQLYLMAAAIRNLKTKEIAWEKEAK